MSVRVMSLVWEADLPSMEKFLLLAIADRCNDAVSYTHLTLPTKA